MIWKKSLFENAFGHLQSQKLMICFGSKKPVFWFQIVSKKVEKIEAEKFFSALTNLQIDLK